MEKFHSFAFFSHSPSLLVFLHCTEVKEIQKAKLEILRVRRRPSFAQQFFAACWSPLFGIFVLMIICDTTDCGAGAAGLKIGSDMTDISFHQN